MALSRLVCMSVGDRQHDNAETGKGEWNVPPRKWYISMIQIASRRVFVYERCVCRFIAIRETKTKTKNEFCLLHHSLLLLGTKLQTIPVGTRKWEDSRNNPKSVWHWEHTLPWLPILPRRPIQQGVISMTGVLPRMMMIVR